MRLESIELLKNRRSFYNLDKNVKPSQADIKKMVEDVVYYSPTPFNVQSERIVVLFDEEHDYLWGDVVMQTLREKVNDDEKFKSTEDKINSFKNAYGTILIFEDEDTIESMKANIGSYAPNLDPWTENSNGIVTIMLWIALKEMGIGANLQHYNPIIDDKVKSKWDIPNNWKLKSQMVFGNIVSDAGEKTTEAIEKRVLFK